MFCLPKKTMLGNIELKDIFEFYDIPRLFTCKNKTGQHYLVLSIDEDEDQLIWLYLAISVDRLNLLSQKKMDLYSAFKNPENNFLYKVVTDYSSVCVDLSCIFPEQLTNDELPCENTYLTSNTVESSYGLGEINARNSAISSKREVFNLHIYPSNTWRSELSIREFGNTLIYLQDTIDAIGQTCSGKATEKGVISPSILQKTKLNACQIFEGSFGVQLKSDNEDLFEASLMSNAMSELFNLFVIGDEESKLKSKLSELKGRVSSKYEQLLKEFLYMQSDLKIEWGSPNEGRGGNCIFRKYAMKNAVDIISKLDKKESYIFSITGKLIGLNSRTRSFEIQSADKDKFSGKIAKGVEIQSAIIGDIYQSTIEQVIETSSCSGEDKISWELKELIKLGITQFNR